MIAKAEHTVDAETKARIFISYSRKDVAFVDRLEVALKARGFEPLIDRTEIYAFEDWWQRLQALIDRADTVVFVLSPDAVASREALKEVEYAASLNKRFAPIVCRRVDDSAVPDTLRRLNFIFFDDPARFDVGADALAAAIETDISWIRKHTAFGEQALHWWASGRPGGLLARSPALEDAERWISSRPHHAPAPTEATRSFVMESRRGATRRRNILTGGLAAGLVVALVLAGLAYKEERTAKEERQRAEDTLAAATKTANGLVFDLAQRFRDSVGIPASLIKDVLDRARALQEQLGQSGQLTPDLKVSEAAALDETARSLLSIGDTGGALVAAEQVQKLMQDLLATDPGNASWQTIFSVSYATVGDVQMAKGDLAAALKSYRASLAIVEPLAKSFPDTADLQGRLSAAYERIGDILLAQGDLAGALKSFQDDLAIGERLAQSDPQNAGWQHDLSVSQQRIGDAALAQGDLTGALKSYRDSVAILEQLAKSEPGNGALQRNLSVSLDKVGNAQMAQGNLTGAL